MKNIQLEPLTPAVFYILLALSLKERHGYDIMKQVENDSNGYVKMGPGTLYGSIKRMLEAGLIIEIDNPDDDRRRLYRLTPTGKKHLSSELKRYSDVANLANTRNLIYNGNFNLNL